MEDKKIEFKVGLNEKKFPNKINWINSDSDKVQDVKALFISGWDEKQRNSLTMNLWTDDMRVDEMHHFFYQTLLNIAADFEKATGNDFVLDDMKAFCDNFAKKTDPS